MSTVVLDTETVKTDAEAAMKYVRATFTTVSFAVKNPSRSTATFRLVTGSGNYTNLTPRSAAVGVASGDTATLVAVKLQIGTSYNFFLQRDEADSWVRQGEGDTKKTHSISELNVSTSSRAAVVSWPMTHTGEYSVDVSLQSSVTSVVPKLDSDTRRYTAVFGSLKSGAEYGVQVRYTENTGSGTAPTVVAKSSFVPSPLANLEVDAVFASFVDLSWDDGDVGDDEADGEADFMIQAYSQNDKTWSVVMDWTPDTTKTTSATGLVPGSTYTIRLSRRGVDGKTVIQQQKQVTTKTTNLRASARWSTKLAILWDQMYDGAVYKWSLAPKGSEGALRQTSATRFDARNLIPDTDYTFDLFIVEKENDSFVKTVDARTDKSGVLSLKQAKHTTVSFNVQNFSSSTTSYYVANQDNSFVSSRFSMNDEDVSREIEVQGLSPNSKHVFSLFRAEYGQWIKQTASGLQDHVPVITKAISAGTSVASASAQVKWEEGYEGALYEMSIFDEAPTSGSTPMQITPNDEIVDSDGTRSVIVTGLEKETEYWGNITVAENLASGGTQKIQIGTFSFTTSAGAVFRVGTVKASSAALEWDAGEVIEEDGVAEFRVTTTKVSSGKESDSTTWLADDTSSATVSGLEPGVDYKFKLYRKGLDGSRVFQAEIKLATKTSALSVSEITSSNIQVEWTTLYDKAQYLVMYTPEKGETLTFSGGPILETQALLTGLEPNTQYVIELYVLENGRAVGVSTVALGSAVRTKTTHNIVLIGGAAAVIALLIVLMIAKMRK